jgi:hypothetical protein
VVNILSEVVFKKNGREAKRNTSFGNSAISIMKIRGFPPPPHGELGFLGEYVEI